MIKMKHKKVNLKNVERIIAMNEDTKKQVCKVLGVCYPTLQKKLDGTHDWKLTECKLLADRYNTTIEELFFGDILKG